MFRWVSTKEAQWCSNYCSKVPRSKAIHKNIWILEIIDLTIDDNNWSKVLKIDTIGFVSSRTTHSFYLQNSSSVRGWRSNWTPFYTLDAAKSRARERVNSRTAAAPKHMMHLPSWWNSVKVFEFRYWKRNSSHLERFVLILLLIVFFNQYDSSKFFLPERFWHWLLFYIL